MTDKERLEAIKKKLLVQRSVNERAYESLDLYDLSYEEGDWLISKVEQLQLEIEKLNQVIDWMNEGCEYNNESHLKTYNQLHQAQAKAERYKKALKEIAVYCDTAPFNYIAKQALEK